MVENITLAAFLMQHIQGEDRIALIKMLGDVAEASKKIAGAIDHGALMGNMGSLAAENVQGEVQKALDVISNDIFIECTQQSLSLIHI